MTGDPRIRATLLQMGSDAWDRGYRAGLAVGTGRIEQASNPYAQLSAEAPKLYREAFKQAQPKRTWNPPPWANLFPKQ